MRNGVGIRMELRRSMTTSSFYLVLSVYLSFYLFVIQFPLVYTEELPVDRLLKFELIPCSLQNQKWLLLPEFRRQSPLERHIAFQPLYLHRGA
jgi:hypothetical protein